MHIDSVIKLDEQESATLYFLHNVNTEFHRHPCLQLTISLHDIFLSLETEDKKYREFGFIIRSNLSHKLNTACAINFLLEPDAPYFHLLSHFTENDPIYRLSREEASILAQYFIHTIENKQVFDIEHIVNLLYRPNTSCLCRQDSRIVKATSIISLLPVKQISSKEIADKIYLSESRFLHLFRENLGINFRGYLLWKRLRDVINTLDASATLTTLANDMGFADSAHFSRTCVASFGLRPSELKRALIYNQKMPNNKHGKHIYCLHKQNLDIN